MKARLMTVVAIVLAVAITMSIPTFAIDLSLEGLINYATFTAEVPEDITGDDVLPEEPTEPTDPVEPENPDEPEIPDEPVVPDEPVDPEPPKPTFDELPGNAVVGRMYICAQIKFIGHTWIYIENDFAGDIPVGCYTLKEGAGVSVGTFMFTRRNGIGVYYNVENYCCNELGYKNPAWLGMEITKDQLLKVNNKILSFNYWDLYFNCTFFASQVWNSVSDDFIMPMVFPMFTKAQIKTQGGNGDVYMKPVTEEECFKQKGMGDNATLEVVKHSTLTTPIG